MTPETHPPVADTAPERRCKNCGEPLLGEHCYSCGQPTKGLVRHFSSIIGDFMDSVFELDSRILRTLGPLLFRPGYLSKEYFAGRRVRYVSPVRLFVFMSLVAFFAARLGSDINTGEDIGGNVVIGGGETKKAPAETDNLRSARTVAEVEAIRDRAIAELKEARAETTDIPGLGIGLDVAEQGVRNEAQRRIEAIRKSETTGQPLPIEQDAKGNISFNGTPWDPKTNRLELGWAPKAFNDKLNDQVGHARDNIKRIQRDPNLLKDAFLSTVPTTLFVLLPLFALMLKFAYLFKRRLYMEHLIVALHSHSFLCAGLLLALLLDTAAGWSAAMPWLSSLFGFVEVALLVWMPAYLLLMQKNVYGQGWPMTLIKYFVLGTCYIVLVGFGAAVSLMVSLVSL